MEEKLKFVKKLADKLEENYPYFSSFIYSECPESSFKEERFAGSSQRAVLATFNDLAVAVGSKSNTAKTIFPKENMSDWALCLPLPLTISEAMCGYCSQYFSC